MEIYEGTFSELKGEIDNRKMVVGHLIPSFQKWLEQLNG